MKNDRVLRAGPCAGRAVGREAPNAQKKLAAKQDQLSQLIAMLEQDPSSD
jgi:hypothetical protein